MSEAARRAAEAAARTSYGRLVAMLASRSGDIAAAEDALADALARALSAWAARGVPENPDAWLMTAARRNLGHASGRAGTAAANETTVMLLDEERSEAEPVPFGDDRLKLMFVCAHPAIAADVQAPLMLQTVLGLNAARIAASFLVSPAAMGQKLVRAKVKIRDAGIAFVVPEPDVLAARTGAVLSAIYAAYGTGWEDVLGADAKRKGLAEEAIWLGRLAAELLPDDPEAMGLLSLMLHCEARRAARRDADGAFVPLSDQDPKLWSRTMLPEAEALLRAAARVATPGRFQSEAAIQSLHAQSVMTGEDLRAPLTRLYDLLVTLAPSAGAAVARAVAYGEAGQGSAALAQLDVLEGCTGYQPWWAARARVLWLLGHESAAHQAAATAAGLSDDPAVRAFLLSGGAFRGAAPSA
jgi:RNA polymerase sigma-70 factor (ECF subfamily)